MDRQFVTSRNLKSAGHDLNENILEIEFNSGGIYQYFDVPESTFLALLNAASKGKYFNSQIKEHYSCKRVR